MKWIFGYLTLYFSANVFSFFPIQALENFYWMWRGVFPIFAFFIELPAPSNFLRPLLDSLLCSNYFSTPCISSPLFCIYPYSILFAPGISAFLFICLPRPSECLPLSFERTKTISPQIAARLRKMSGKCYYFEFRHLCIPMKIHFSTFARRPFSLPTTMLDLCRLVSFALQNVNTVMRVRKIPNLPLAHGSIECKTQL